MKQRSLYFQLEDEHQMLTLLRERLSELRYDLEFAENQVKIFYAVDFSEVLGFLRISAEEMDEIDEEITGVNLDREHPEKGYFHYRLGLTHLFNTFNGTLYLLPPHTLELWNYVRAQGETKISQDEQYHQLLEGTRNLDSKYKSLLESLWDVDTTLDPETSQQLLEFIKSPVFKQLCVDVSDFLNWYKRGNALKNLFKVQKLSYRIDNLVSENDLNISELKDPSRDETLSLLKLFPRSRRQYRRSNTLVDSRGLLYLRNINRLLSRVNAAVLLITRDTHLVEVVKSLSDDPSFGWPDARQYVRGIESIFLDLILTGTPSTAGKAHWILESDMKLASMQESISRTLLQLDRTSSSHSQTSVLANLGKKVLEGTAQLWEQQINLKLSLASKNIPWLGRGFLESFSGGQLPAGFKEYRREYKLLKNLFEFLSTKEYQSIATQDVKDILREIEIDCLRMGFLNLLDREGAYRISKVLSETFSGDEASSKTVIKSKRFLKMPTLQFVSSTYQDRLKALQIKGRGNYNRAFLSVISEAVSGFEEPEDLLFMAFVLGMIDEWQEALILINKCRQLVADIDPAVLNTLVVPSEIDYLASLAKRKIAEMQQDPLEAIRGYLEAYEDIHRALNARPDDPKYLKDIAATAMLYHETVKKEQIRARERVIDASSEVFSESEAKSLFKRVLEMPGNSDDIRITLAILNNLAFAEVIADRPSFEDAEVYLRRIDELLEVEPKSDHAASDIDSVLPHIRDTKIMLRARRARDNKDKDELNECINEFNNLLFHNNLTRGEKRTYLSHLELLNIWASELG